MSALPPPAGAHTAVSAPYTTHADLGGQLGHGPVEPRDEDLLFHEPWEPAALEKLMIDRGQLLADELATQVRMGAVVRAHWITSPGDCPLRGLHLPLRTRRGLSAFGRPRGAHGVRGSPVPIMESRVTRVASCSSSMPSVPGGRCGRTR